MEHGYSAPSLCGLELCYSGETTYSPAIRPGAMNRTAMSILLIKGSFQDFLQTSGNLVPDM